MQHDRVEFVASIVSGSRLAGESVHVERKISASRLLKGALMGVAAVPVAALLGRAEAAAGPVDPNEPQAKSLGYVKDATKVDPKANPNFKPGQSCANCLQVPKGKETGAKSRATSSAVASCPAKAGARSG